MELGVNFQFILIFSWSESDQALLREGAWNELTVYSKWVNSLANLLKIFSLFWNSGYSFMVFGNKPSSAEWLSLNKYWDPVTMWTINHILREDNYKGKRLYSLFDWKSNTQKVRTYTGGLYRICFCASPHHLVKLLSV